MVSFVRTRAYTHFNSRKRVHPFTQGIKTDDNQRFSVWTLGLFKPSHSDWSLHTATQSFTKAARWPDRVRKKCDNYKMMLNRTFHFGNFRVNAWIAVWRLEKSKCSHFFPLILRRKQPFCERVNAFFGEKITYIEKRKSVIKWAKNGSHYRERRMPNQKNQVNYR